MGQKSKPVYKSVPAAQALHYQLQRLCESMVWLREIEEEWQAKYKKKEDCYKIGLRSDILSDIVCIYITTLTERGGSGHSLLKSYKPNKFTKNFADLPIIKKCRMNRQNRSAHESRSYGHFVRSEEILNSNIEKWFSEIEYFLVANSENIPPRRANRTIKNRLSFFLKN